MVTLSVKSNIKAFSKTLSKFEKKQLPFATAQAMNDTIADVRKQIVDTTWPRSVEVRNRRFAGVAFRRKFAKKTKLRASLFDSLGREAFNRQADGGIRIAHGNFLAVPSENIKRTGKGVRANQRPRALKRSFVATMKSGKRGIFQRTGKRKIRLMYSLTRTANVPKSFPFERDAERIARRKFGKHFVKRFNHAVRTARL